MWTEPQKERMKIFWLEIFIKKMLPFLCNDDNYNYIVVIFSKRSQSWGAQDTFHKFKFLLAKIVLHIFYSSLLFTHQSFLFWRVPFLVMEGCWIFYENYFLFGILKKSVEDSIFCFVLWIWGHIAFWFLDLNWKVDFLGGGCIFIDEL